MRASNGNEQNGNNAEPHPGHHHLGVRPVLGVGAVGHAAEGMAVRERIYRLLDWVGDLDINFRPWFKRLIWIGLIAAYFWMEARK